MPTLFSTWFPHNMVENLCIVPSHDLLTTWRKLYGERRRLLDSTINNFGSFHMVKKFDFYQLFYLKNLFLKCLLHIYLSYRLLAWPSTILQKRNIIILWGKSHDITRIFSWNDEKSHDFVMFLWRHLAFFSHFHEKFLIIL